MSLQVCVHWVDLHVLQPADSGARCELIDGDGALELGLARANELRRAGMRHVGLTTENTDLVGSMGVEAVKDGLTPDGKPYDWKKRRV